MPTLLGSRMNTWSVIRHFSSRTRSSRARQDEYDRKTSFLYFSGSHRQRSREGSLTIVTPLRIISEEMIRTTTQQDVGCCKLLQQHMYGRARFLMLARPVRPSLHDVRQHAADAKRTAANKCSHGRDKITGWWSQTGSNRRPHACKARALPAELWPRSQIRSPARLLSLAARQSKLQSSKGWWAWEDLNFRPHAYQARALTN